MQVAQSSREHTAQLSVMQGAYAQPMTVELDPHAKHERPYRRNRRLHLRYLARKHKTDRALAEKLRTPAAHLSAMLAGTKNIGDELATRCEQLEGMHPGWMDEALTPPELAAIGEPGPPVQLRPLRQETITDPPALFAGIARMCEPLDRAGRKMVAAALEEAAINPESASVQADRVAGVLMPTAGKERTG